ncbi:MAG: DUF2971 domain-containing protein [Bacteroidales bacterium]|nr:DUF2971 domain-containing protein [Bacteroidales bacterium]MBN2749644.1 DUF2971 domain-containing protein [Bacteroidales bacterium]
MRTIDQIARIIYEKSENIFHYTTTEAFKNIIETSEIWITKYNDLNDPTEFNYGINLIDKILNEKPYFTRTINKDELKKSLKKRLQYTFVSSFTNCPDSHLMWSSYSRNKGLCFQCNSNFLARNINQFTIVEGKVIYDQKQQEELLIDIFENTILSSQKPEPLKLFETSSLFNLLVFCMTIFKQEGLYGEEEYRFSLIGEDNYFEEIEKLINTRINCEREISFIKLKINRNSIISITSPPNIHNNKLYLSLKPLFDKYNLKIESNHSKIILR